MKIDKNVQFLNNVNDIILPKLPEDTWIIYKNGYDIPDIENIRGSIEFNEYKKIYHNIHANLFIFIGLNKIATPSNRTDFVFEHLFTITRDVQKISVDNEPFIGEPWRVWFHYGMCGVGKFNVPYSYTIETEWKHWFLRKAKTSKLESDNIGFCITNTYSDIPTLSYNFRFDENIDNRWYEEAKDFVFNKYTTPKLWVNNLLKMCNDKFNVKYGFDSFRENKNFILPDLPVYRFVNEENLRRVNSYNKILTVSR